MNELKWNGCVWVSVYSICGRLDIIMSCCIHLNSRCLNCVVYEPENIWKWKPPANEFKRTHSHIRITILKMSFWSPFENGIRTFFFDYFSLWSTVSNTLFLPLTVFISLASLSLSLTPSLSHSRVRHSSHRMWKKNWVNVFLDARKKMLKRRRQVKKTSTKSTTIHNTNLGNQPNIIMGKINLGNILSTFDIFL